MSYLLLPGSGSPVFQCGDRLLRLRFTTPASVRITCTEGRGFLDKPSLIVLNNEDCGDWQLREEECHYEVSTAQLRVRLNKATGALSYHEGTGRLLFQEPERGGRWLTPRQLHRNVFDHSRAGSTAQNIDGARASAAGYETVVDRQAFEAKLEFEFSEGEALYGLGSHEEGLGNLRGQARELYQQNMKAVVPVLVSSRGYAVLLDCCSLMTFHDDALGSYWWADAVDELDYHVIAGADHAAVLRGVHTLTGRPTLLPRWAFGYAQSKERYVNAEELVSVVEEYRKRDIPLDLIVLDWKSWPNGSGWGQKGFDPVRFPDPKAMTGRLHELGAKLMVSIWPIMTGGCDNQRELQDKGLMLGNQSTYDAFNEAGRKCYWEQARRGLFEQGVDAWWCDCTEPFEADWAGAVKPEPHKRLALNTAQSKLYIDESLINAYSLEHSKGIWEGQRAAAPERRVLNLTRSSYAGQHRYGTVTWNGDICGTWETLRRCIPEGLNFCATGEPWWTVDIGGFFVANDPKLWFWRGDYNAGCRGLTDMNALQPDPADTGCSDLGYHELYLRWLQYAVFLPMFRSHGTDASREVWRFGEPGNRIHDALVTGIRQRYSLLHYLYSCAAGAALRGEPMMQPLGLAFPDDRQGHSVNDQFLCGPSLLVCPVTKPMHHGPGSTPLSGIPETREVWLPAGIDWINFHSGEKHRGGQWLTVAAPLEHIPVFVRAGSVLPLCTAAHNVDSTLAGPVELRVYPGADGSFIWYEDSGDGHEYEQGTCRLTTLRWEDVTQTLHVDRSRDTCTDAPARHTLCIRRSDWPAQASVHLDDAGGAAELGLPKDPP